MKNHETRPGTMKIQPRTMKNHKNSPNARPQMTSFDPKSSTNAGRRVLTDLLDV